MLRVARHFLIVAAICAWALPACGLTLAPGKRLAANAAVDRMISSDFSGALALCDSMIRTDEADPLAWMLRLAAIGLHDLDLDSAVKSLDFDTGFAKVSRVLDAYERTNGVSSYSLTVKGFARATAAAYYLWRKKYLAGLDLGFDALARLGEAKKLDNANLDVDFFLGLYTYARADLKKTFWWAFFWYQGEKEEGIRSLRSCSSGSQFCRRAADLVLGEVLYREKRYRESDSVTSALSRSYPQSRLIRWTCAKRAESARVWTDAAGYYRTLANEYDSIPAARRNCSMTRNKAAHMYFLAGNRVEALRECRILLGRCDPSADTFCRQLAEDTRKLQSKISETE